MNRVILYMMCFSIFAKGIVRDSCTKTAIFKNDISLSEMHERLQIQQDVLRSPKICTALKLLAANTLDELSPEQQRKLLRIVLYTKGLHDAYSDKSCKSDKKDGHIQNHGLLFFEDLWDWIIVGAVAVTGIAAVAFSLPISVSIGSALIVSSGTFIFSPGNNTLPPPIVDPFFESTLRGLQEHTEEDKLGALSQPGAVFDTYLIPRHTFNAFSHEMAFDSFNAGIPIGVGYVSKDSYPNAYIRPGSVAISVPCMTHREKAIFWNTLPSEIQFNDEYDECLWGALPCGTLLGSEKNPKTNIVDIALNGAESSLDRAFYLNTTIESPIFTSLVLRPNDVTKLMEFYFEDSKLLEEMEKNPSLEALFDKEAIRQRAYAAKNTIKGTLGISIDFYKTVDDIRKLQATFDKAIFDIVKKRSVATVIFKSPVALCLYSPDSNFPVQQAWLNVSLKRFAPDFVGAKIPDIPLSYSAEKLCTTRWSKSMYAPMNHSTIFQLSAFYPEVSKINDSAIFFVNGVNTTLDEAQRSAKYISEFANDSEVVVIYNATHGLFQDLDEARANIRGLISEPGVNVVTGVNSYFKSHTSQDAMITVFCHSQGVAIVSNALRYISQEYRDMTIIRAIAPSVRIPDDTVADVQHYKSDADGILKVIERFTQTSIEGDNVITVESKDKHPLTSHSFKSENYAETISYNAYETVRNKDKSRRKK